MSELTNIEKQAANTLIECDQCGGSGFDGHGTGYDDVCGKCGGLKEYYPTTAAELEQAVNILRSKQ